MGMLGFERLLSSLHTHHVHPLHAVLDDGLVEPPSDGGRRPRPESHAAELVLPTGPEAYALPHDAHVVRLI